MKNEFHYGFEISRKVIFEVSYYTLGNNKHAHFSTSAFEFNQPKTDFRSGGQAQERLLPKCSAAYRFFAKWDKKHLRDLTIEEYSEMCNDLESLKEKYNFVCIEQPSFAGTSSGLSFIQLKNLSMQELKK